MSFKELQVLFFLTVGGDKDLMKSVSSETAMLSIFGIARFFCRNINYQRILFRRLLICLSTVIILLVAGINKLILSNIRSDWEMEKMPLQVKFCLRLRTSGVRTCQELPSRLDMYRNSQ